MSEAMKVAAIDYSATSRTTAGAPLWLIIGRNPVQRTVTTLARAGIMPILFVVLLLAALSQTLRAQPYAELWPGTSIDIKSCFTNHKYVVDSRGMLISSHRIQPTPPGRGQVFCFTGAIGPGYIGVLTIKVAAEADKFRAGAFAIVDEPGGKSYLGRRLLQDRLVQQSRQRRGRLLVIPPDHSKPRRFALVMVQGGTRHGRVIVSFHAVNPLWQAIQGGVQSMLIEGLARHLAQGADAQGPAAEMTAALAQLAINAAITGNSEDSTDFIVNGLAGIAPHLNEHIPALGTTWMAQTFVNIRKTIYKGFDRRYRLSPK